MMNSTWAVWSVKSGMMYIAKASLEQGQSPKIILFMRPDESANTSHSMIELLIAYDGHCNVDTNKNNKQRRLSSQKRRPTCHIRLWFFGVQPCTHVRGMQDF